MDLIWQVRRPYSGMRHTPDLKTVSDDDLLRRLTELLSQSRRVEADVVAHIAEVDERKLYAREAAPSMFAYCVDVLHLSEHEAYLRITAARASRKNPVLLSMLRDGRLQLSGIALLARHLTRENRDEILRRATHMPHRRLKELVAELAPRPDVAATIRRLPPPRAGAQAVHAGQLGTYRVASGALTSRPAGTISARHEAPPGGVTPDGLQGSVEMGDSSAVVSSDSVQACHPPALIQPDLPAGRPAVRTAVVEPLSPARFRVQFTADAELREMLDRLQALMRCSVPDGDLATILKVAVAEKLQRLEAKRFAKTKKPRKSLAETDTHLKSRYIPAPVRRAVHERDEGRCTYRDKQGKRCTETRHLEFHHRVPFGKGGEHRPENLTLHCWTHNNLVAERDYGEDVMWSRRRRSSSALPDRTPSVPVSRRRGHG